MMILVLPVITFFMGSLTFLLAFIHGKELRRILPINRAELRKTAPHYKKISLDFVLRRA